MNRWTCALAALLLGSAGAAAAQATDALARPKYSLSFGTFAGPQIAAGVRLSRWADLSLAVGAGDSRSGARMDGGQPDDFHTRTLYLEPSLKRYLGAGGPLAPYFAVGVYAQRATAAEHSAPGPQGASNGWRDVQTSVGLDVGLGAEWFITQRVSLGGRIGAGASLQRETSRADGYTTVHGHGWRLGTQGSGVEATLYL